MALVYPYYAHLIIAGFVVAAAYASGLGAGQLFGRAPRRSDIRSVLKLDVFLFSVASLLIALIYIPVSFVLPDFVQWWLDWSYWPIVYLTAAGDWPLIPNFLSLLSLVAIGPALEEILFRGFLLHRFSLKWGLPIGVLASSALFGALHPDTLGAAIFGVGMCVLYLQTRSLYVPIIAHGVYNLAVWLWELYGVLDDGLEYYVYTVEQFRSDWEIGAVGALVAVLMIHHYFQARKTTLPRRLLVT